MIGLNKLRRALLRWDRLLSAVVVGLPFTLMSVLGFLWLLEHGWLIWFVSFSLGLAVLLTVARWLARRKVTRSSASSPQGEHLAVAADPDWLPHEREAFVEVCLHIEKITEEGVAWESLREHALDVVNRIARSMGEERTALDFTLPEALLLVERTTVRYRRLLRDKVPFSDQVSISTLYWLWSRRERLSRIWTVADWGRRVARMALNPTRSLLLEIEQVVAGGNSSFLTVEMMGTMQAVLLEEVAFSAVELYSGRLRFSDAELLDIQLAASDADRTRLAKPDEPLRILLVGQISAGKSTLLNALLEGEQAEIDAAPTTPGLVTWQADVNGVPCHFLDSQGLDGSRRNREQLCEEMVDSDLIIWLIRADRPAREPDLQLKKVFDAWFIANPSRRKPVIIALATCMDRLAEGWPYPEHNLPQHVREKFAQVVDVIGQDLDGLKPRPVSSVAPPWNIESVTSAIVSHLSEALMVQRNRRRTEAAGARGSVLQQARRRGRQVVSMAKLYGRRVNKQK